MSDATIFQKWFDKIDHDIQYLTDCFAEVLDELGDSEVADALPWRTVSEDDDSAAQVVPTKIERELQVLSIGYHLLNIVEENAALQARRERENAPGSRHEPGLWEHSLRQSLDANSSQEDIARALETFEVEIVLTAHPTEAKRRPVLRQHRALFKEFSKLEFPHWTKSERTSIRERIKVILERLWRTGEMYLEKPDVLSELDHIQDYFLEIFPSAIPLLKQRLDGAWKEAGLPAGALSKVFPGPNLRFGNWVGGDRDGHPLVTPEITRITLARSRRNALRVVRTRLETLRDNLTLSDLFQTPPEELTEANTRYGAIQSATDEDGLPYTHEPWRQYVYFLLQKLNNASDSGFEGYSRPEQLVMDLKLLRDSLESVGAHRLAESEIDPLIMHLNIFGFHLAAVDIRQNSEYHAKAASQMLAAAGFEDWDFASWDPGKQLVFMEKELTSLRPLVPRNRNIGEEATNVLGYFQIVADHIATYGPDGIGKFIVSMTRNSSDLRVMYLFAREVGLLHLDEGNIRSAISIVPLFETLSDLDHAAGVMREFFEFPITKNTLQSESPSSRKQEVMVGYSDSNKDAGIFSSHWGLNRAQKELQEVGNQYGVDIAFFHGRGGTFSRGAGPIHRFLESLPGGSLRGGIRMTEQGEVIAQKFGNLPTAAYNLELLLAGATVSALEHQKASGDDERYAEICERLSVFSSDAYRDLLSSQDFLDFWTHATPIDALELSFIGSRPTRRTGKRTIEDLRAIPWVFSWTQARFYLTGWYGIGSALHKLKQEDPDGYQYLKDQRSSSSFVHYVLLNAETSLASGDPESMEKYSKLVPDEKIRTQQLARIMNEHQLTESMMDDFFEASRAKRRPRLVKTLDMRAEGLRRLHSRQIKLLRKWRASTAEGNEQQADDLFPLVLLSINAIAGAERTTG